MAVSLSFLVLMRKPLAAIRVWDTSSVLIWISWDSFDQAIRFALNLLAQSGPKAYARIGKHGCEVGPIGYVGEGV
jgi:hypothetical protein